MPDELRLTLSESEHTIRQEVSIYNVTRLIRLTNAKTAPEAESETPLDKGTEEDMAIPISQAQLDGHNQDAASGRLQIGGNGG